MSSTPTTEYTLAILRVVCLRLKLIDGEAASIGVALRQGLITSKQAREMVEEIAPGCIDAVALSILEEGTGE
jgi:hypothetical protein